MYLDSLKIFRDCGGFLDYMYSVQFCRSISECAFSFSNFFEKLTYEIKQHFIKIQGVNFENLLKQFNRICQVVQHKICEIYLLPDFVSVKTNHI